MRPSFIYDLGKLLHCTEYVMHARRISLTVYLKKKRSWILAKRSRDRSVGVAMGYGLKDRGSIPGSEAHPASYPMGTRGSFPGGKVTVAFS
jgi:hypothetical protein